MCRLRIKDNLMSNKLLYLYLKSKIFLMRKQYLLLLLFIGLISLSSNCKADWEQTNGPYGANVLCMNSQFVGTDVGIFRTIDGGNTWVASNNGLPKLLRINTITITYFGSILIGTSKGIYRSTNVGYSWESMYTCLSNIEVTALFEYGGYLFAGTKGNGIFYLYGNICESANNGLSDLFINSFYYIPHMQLQDPNGNNFLYVTTQNGIYYCDLLLFPPDSPVVWSYAGISNYNVKAMGVLPSKIIAGSYGNGLFASKLFPYTTLFRHRKSVV